MNRIDICNGFVLQRYGKFFLQPKLILNEDRQISRPWQAKSLTFVTHGSERIFNAMNRVLRAVFFFKKKHLS